jgi:hypothetical protein
MVVYMTDTSDNIQRSSKTSNDLVRRMRDLWARIEPGTDDIALMTQVSAILIESAFRLETLEGEHENISRGRLPTHRCKVCDTFWMDLPEHNASTMVGIRCGETCCVGTNIEKLPVAQGITRMATVEPPHPETPVVDPRIREIMECNDPGNAKTIYGTAKAGEQRTQVCDCDVGLCCKTNRRTNQYCRIDPPLANGAVSIKSLDVTALSEDAPYCRYQEKGRTCKCNPVCVTCGWGQHATIHEVALTYPGAHQFEPMSEHQ